MKEKKNAFTLIELISVLVIMAIIALIVTPLVMSIIKKARISADKRSIDAYGRSIELAVAGYLLDNGYFPTNVDQLTIEYSGNEVVCTTTQLNSDSSVYLDGCTVAGRSVEGYTYGSEEGVSYTAYEVGDEVRYNNVDYYVIKDSSVLDETVTLLKAEPLTTDEVNMFGVGHVNKYTGTSVGTAYNGEGYGVIAYYSSETCGFINYSAVETGCTTNYLSSDIKYVVDAWANAKTNSNDLVVARLISYDEFGNLGYEWTNTDTSGGVNMKWKKTDNALTFVYDYNYWTDTAQNDSSSTVWYMNSYGDISSASVYGYLGDPGRSVRPVLELNKSADITKLN